MNNKFFEFKDNLGLFEITKEHSKLNLTKLAKLPVWMNPITSNDSLIFYCNFNGVNYNGLGIYNAKNKSATTIALTKHGIPTNYFYNITTFKNYIALVSGNEVYFSKYPFLLFNKIPLTETVLQSKIINGKLIILTQKGAYIFKLKKNSSWLIKFFKITNGEKIISDNIPNTFWVLANNQVIQYDLESMKEKSRINIPDNINLKSFLTIPIGKLILFYNENGSIIFDKNHFIRNPFFSANKVIHHGGYIYIFNNNNVNIVNVKTFTSNRNISFQKSNGYLTIKKQNNNKGLFVSWSGTGKYWHPFIPCQELKISLDSLKNNELNLCALNSDFSFAKKKYHFHTFDANSLILVLIIILGLIIITVNYFVFVSRKLHLSKISILSFVFIIAIYLFEKHNITYSNYTFLLIAFEILSISIFIVYRNLLNRNSEYLKEIHSFNHGNIGFNNIQHLKRICDYQTNYKAIDKNNYFQSLDIALKNYQNLSYPLIHKLITKLPLNYKWLKELFFISTYSYKLEKTTLEYNNNTLKINEICRYSNKLYVMLTGLRQKVYLTFSTNPDKVIQSVLIFYKSKYRDISFSYKINGRVSLVLISAIELKNILSNLIDNAIESIYKKKDELEEKSTNQPTIEILLAAETFYHYITIKDNGIQLPLIEKEVLFDLSYTNKGKGGFGLYEVKTTINKYFGDVDIQENNNQEKLFTLKLKTTYV